MRHDVIGFEVMYFDEVMWLVDEVICHLWGACARIPFGGRYLACASVVFRLYPCFCFVCLTCFGSRNVRCNWLFFGYFSRKTCRRAFPRIRVSIQHDLTCLILACLT